MYQLEWLTLLASLGLAGGLLAGLVGLGGGIILAPLLLYTPWALGFEPLDMKVVARLTVLQSLCSTAAAGLAHGRARLVHVSLVRWMGPIILIASLAGGYVSEARVVTSQLLSGLFAGLATLAALLMLLGLSAGSNDDQITVDMPVNRVKSGLIAAGVGFLGGMVGQSGAFLTIPLLVHVLRMPLRLAIGSSLFITFCAAAAGSFGKFAGGGTVNWSHAGALVTGSLIGSQLGTFIGRHTPTTYLRYSLAALITVVAARMWYEVLL